MKTGIRWVAAMWVFLAWSLAAQVPEALRLPAGGRRIRYGKTELEFRPCGRGLALRTLAFDGIELLAERDMLWTAEFRDREGRRFMLTSLEAVPQFHLDRRHVDMTWRVAVPGRAAAPVVRVDVDFGAPGRTEWRIAFADVPADLALYRYTFPCCAIRVPESESCAWVEPCDWGTITTNPLQRLPSRSRRYPSSTTTMQFFALERPGGVVYVGCHDRHARRKDFVVHANARHTALAFSVAQTVGLRYGHAYRQEYPFVLRWLSGDWYDAAREYRRWALTAPWTWRGPLAAGHKTPESAWRTPLVLLRLGRETLNPAFVADWAIRTQRWFDVPVILHWYNWHRSYGSDSIDCYPHYFPARPGFREAIGRMEHAGIRVMPYFNTRLWRTDFASWEQQGRFAAVRDPYNRIHREVWMKIPTAVMSPASSVWREVIGGQMEKAIKAGVGGIYMDQLAESVPWPDYAPEHGTVPGDPDAWLRGCRELGERLRREGSTRRPDLILASEGSAEPYISMVDTMLCGNLNAPDSIPLQAAVYHDYVMHFGRYIMAGDLTLPKAVLAKFAQQCIFGGQFGWSRAILDNYLSDDNAEACCLRRLAKLRYEYADLLVRGQFLRPLVFSTPPPDVSLTWFQWNRKTSLTLPMVLTSVWQGPQGRVGVWMVNLGDTTQTLPISLPSGRYPVASNPRGVLHTFDDQGHPRDEELVSRDGVWPVSLPALTPGLFVVDGKTPTWPPPARPPVRSGPEPSKSTKADGPAFQPFKVDMVPESQADSGNFPFCYEGDGFPWESTPAWVGPGSPRQAWTRALTMQSGHLVIDTLAPGVPGGTLLRLPAGPVWDVDRMIGFTLEARLRVTACNDNPRFAFWLQTNTATGLMCLQIFPGKILVPGRKPLVVDMAADFRTLRLVGLPGGKALRLYIDGRVRLDAVPYLGGHPSQAQCAFGAGASAGRFRAEVDYIRLLPWKAVIP